MTLPDLIFLAAVVYAGIGILLGLWFVSSGASKLDSNARGATWLFRLLILPGSAALWPVLLMKLRRKPEAS